MSATKPAASTWFRGWPAFCVKNAATVSRFLAGEISEEKLVSRDGVMGIVELDVDEESG